MRIERLKSEIDKVEKEFRYWQKIHKKERVSKHSEEDVKEQYDYFEGVFEGLATALKIMQGEIL